MKLFFLRNLELLFQLILSVSSLMFSMNCFLDDLFFLGLWRLVRLELGGLSQAAFSYYLSIYCCSFTDCSLAALGYCFGGRETDYLADSFNCLDDCCFMGYLVFLMLLGEFEACLSFSFPTLSAFLSTLPLSAPPMLFSSTFLISSLHLSLKLLTLVSLQNLNSLGNSGKATFFSIFALSLSKAEPGKQSAPQTQRHSWTMRKKVLDSFTRLIISSSEMFLSNWRQKQVLPLWMLLTGALYSMISAKCTSTDFSRHSAVKKEPASRASFKNWSAHTLPAGAWQPNRPTTLRMAGLSLGWSGERRMSSSRALPLSMVRKSAMSRKCSMQELRSASVRSLGEGGRRGGGGWDM